MVLNVIIGVIIGIIIGFLWRDICLKTITKKPTNQ